MVKLSQHQREELTLDIVAYLSEYKHVATLTDKQLHDILVVLAATDIDHSLAVHLMLNPGLVDLFEEIRLTVRNQHVGQEADIETLANKWAHDVFCQYGVNSRMQSASLPV